MREYRFTHFLHTATCRAIVGCAAILAAAGLFAQQPSAPAPQQQPAPMPPYEKQPSAPPAAQSAPAQPVSQELATPTPSAPINPFVLSAAEQTTDAPAVREDQLRQQLQGKTFYLRSGYLDNTLHFDEQGHLLDKSPQAPYTLSLVEIERVRLQKHRIEIEAVRYGLHFLGASATEDQAAAIDRVRLTTKKKPLIITIDREDVMKPKKEKEKDKGSKHPVPQSAGSAAASAAPQAPPQAEDEDKGRHRAETTSQAHANRTLAQAVDTVFAASIDDRMIASLPDYWKLFYKSIAEHREWRPSDPAILRQSAVDQKAVLVSVIDPPSNEFAQNNGVTGIAMYHVVLSSDGKPREIAVGRPIGFGLDENAVKAIHEAKFQPAIKGGRPVPVTLDLLVQFRIYSKRTAEASNRAAAAAAQSTLPGPYTANAPRPEPAPEPAQQPASPAENPQQPAESTSPVAQPAQQPATPPPDQKPQ